MRRSAAPAYPGWLRGWHWANAALFVVLMVTGFSMHFASPGSRLVPFRAARIWHNASAIAILVLWAAFLAVSAWNGHWRQYVPRLRGLVAGVVRQARWYLVGIFRSESHPFEPTEKSRFNPLQRVAYLAIMAGWFPLAGLTGLLLLFPELAPDRVLGLGGIWPVAQAHVVAAFAGTVFLLSHAYLATTGNTWGEYYRLMITGVDSRSGPGRR